MNSSGFAEFSAATIAVFLAGLVAGRFLACLVFFSSAWFLFLYLDVASTAEIYRQSPITFRRAERNRIFAVLAEKLKLPLAVLAFILFVELPVFVLISATVAPLLEPYIAGSSSLVSRFTASAGALAVAHADGWRTNRRTNVSWNKKESPQKTDDEHEG